MRASFAAVALAAACALPGCPQRCAGNGPPARYSNGTELTVDAAIRDLLVGDVVGGPEKELAAVSATEVQVFDLSGRLLRRRSFPKESFGAGLLADVDQDGKLDLLLGTKHSAAAKVTILNGLLFPLRSFPIIDSIDGTTIPAAVRDGVVYAYSFSAANSSPKFVAGLSLRDGKTLFYQPLGPKPHSLDLAEDGTVMVGAMGVGKEGRRVARPYGHPRDRNAIFLIGPHGAPSETLWLDGPMGWEGRAGDGAVYPTARFIATAAGEERILRVTNAVSGLTGIRPELVLSDRSGAVFARRLGPPASECTVAENPRPRTWTIAAAWRNGGTIEFLNDRLETVRSVELPGRGNDVRILDAADADGNGATKLLVQSGRKLFLVDEGGLRSAVPFLQGPLRGAKILNGGERPRAVAWTAGALRIIGFDADEGEAPNPEMAADSARPSTGDAAPGRSFDAKPFLLADRRVPRPIAPVGAASAATLRTSIPREGRSAFFLADAMPAPGKELCVLSADAGFLEILDPSGSVLRRLPLGTDEGYSAESVGDFDGDGYADFAVYGTEPMSVRFIDADGRTLFSTRFFYSNETWLSCSHWDDRRLVFSVHAGYRGSPRGAVVVDRSTGIAERILVGANSVLENTVFAHEGLLFVPVSTPSNGVVVRLPSGLEESDSSLLLKVYDIDSGELICALKSPAEPPADRGFFIPFAVRGQDGAVLLFATEGKFNGYYDGKPALYRIERPEWRLTKVLDGPENAVGFAPAEGRVGGRVVYFQFWANPYALDLLSEDFTVHRRIVTATPVYPSAARVLDLDGDGNSEIVTVKGGKFFILSWDGRELLSFGSEDRPIAWFDMDYASKDQGILFYALEKDRVEVYELK